MSEITDASDYIKRQSSLQKGFVLLAEQLDRIGSLEQAEKETQKRLNELRGAVPGAQAELDRIKAGIAEAEDSAATILLDASNAAKAFGDSAAAKAQEQAEQTIANAQSIAVKVKADAADQVDIARAELASLQTLSQATQETVNEQNAQVAAAKAELARVTEAIEQLKAKLA